MLVYDHKDDWDGFTFPEWTPDAIKNNDQVKEYAHRARNVVRHVGYQARGRASGVHGLLHQSVPPCPIGALAIDIGSGSASTPLLCSPSLQQDPMDSMP